LTQRFLHNAKGTKLYRVIGFLLFILFTGTSAMAQSEQDDSGRFDAYTCEKLPSPLKIDVQVLDYTQRNLRLRDKFTARLNDDRIETATEAPFVLTHDIKTLREFAGQDSPALSKLHIGKGSGVSLRGKLWSNNDDRSWAAAKEPYGILPSISFKLRQILIGMTMGAVFGRDKFSTIFVAPIPTLLRTG